MGDFIYGAIKGFLISIIPIAILLGLGLIGLAWPWLKFLVYGVAGLISILILWTILLIVFFPEIRKHDLGWPLTYGYIWRKIWPFRKKYGTAINRKFLKRYENERRVERNQNIILFLMVFGIIVSLIFATLCIVKTLEMWAVVLITIAEGIFLSCCGFGISKLVTVMKDEYKLYEYEILGTNSNGQYLLTEEGRQRLEKIRKDENNRATIISISLLALFMVVVAVCLTFI